MLSLLFGRHNGRQRETGFSLSEMEGLSQFEGEVSDKIGEKHFIVDHAGHFETTKQIADEGMAEGYLIYGGACPVNRYTHHLYTPRLDLTE